jgi:hypothetical protein
MSIDQQLSMGSDPSSPDADTGSVNQPLRLRLPIAMLVLFWPLQLAISNLEMAMLPRFLSRTILTLLLLLGFFGGGLRIGILIGRGSSLSLRSPLHRA